MKGSALSAPHTPSTLVMVCQVHQYAPDTWICVSELVLRLAHHSVRHACLFLIFIQRRVQRVRCLLVLPCQAHQCVPDTCDYESHILMRLTQLAREATSFCYKNSLISRIKGQLSILFSHTL